MVCYSKSWAWLLVISIIGFVITIILYETVGGKRQGTTAWWIWILWILFIILFILAVILYVLSSKGINCVGRGGFEKPAKPQEVVIETTPLTSTQTQGVRIEQPKRQSSRTIYSIPTE